MPQCALGLSAAVGGLHAEPADNSTMQQTNAQSGSTSVCRGRTNGARHNSCGGLQWGSKGVCRLAGVDLMMLVLPNASGFVVMTQHLS